MNSDYYKTFFSIKILPSITGSVDISQIYYWNDWYPYEYYKWYGFHARYRSAAHKLELKNKIKTILQKKRIKIWLKYIPQSNNDSNKVILSFF